MQFSHDLTLDILSKGELAIKGEFLWGSNYTFLVDVHSEKGELAAVYKPTAACDLYGIFLTPAWRGARRLRFL